MQQGAFDDTRGDITQREGKSVHRDLGELGPHQHSRETSGRDREDPLQEVHEVHDDARRELRRAETEADRGLRHQLPHHQLSHRTDVQAQASRLRYPLHGGDRQGGVRDEAGRQR